MSTHPLVCTILLCCRVLEYTVCHSSMAHRIARACASPSITESQRSITTTTTRAGATTSPPPPAPPTRQFLTPSPGFWTLESLYLSSSSLTCFPPKLFNFFSAAFGQAFPRITCRGGARGAGKARRESIRMCCVTAFLVLKPEGRFF